MEDLFWRDTRKIISLNRETQVRPSYQQRCACEYKYTGIYLKIISPCLPVAFLTLALPPDIKGEGI